MATVIIAATDRIVSQKKIQAKWGWRKISIEWWCNDPRMISCLNTLVLFFMTERSCSSWKSQSNVVQMRYGWGTNDVRTRLFCVPFLLIVYAKYWLNPNVLRRCYEDVTKMPRRCHGIYISFFSFDMDQVSFELIWFFLLLYCQTGIALFAWFVSLTSMNAYMMDE